MKNLKQQIDIFVAERLNMSASELSKLIFEQFGEKYTDAGIRTLKHRLRKNQPVQKMHQLKYKPNHLLKFVAITLLSIGYQKQSSQN